MPERCPQLPVGDVKWVSPYFFKWKGRVYGPYTSSKTQSKIRCYLWSESHLGTSNPVRREDIATIRREIEKLKKKGKF